MLSGYPFGIVWLVVLSQEVTPIITLLCLFLNKGITSQPAPFKFFNMWTSHSDCKRLVTDVWSRSFIGCPMAVLTQKLKALKLELKKWNKDDFGNVHTRSLERLWQLLMTFKP